MMCKNLLTLFVCIKLCYAISLNQNSVPTITEYRNEINNDGYFFKYNLDDGQQREERGELITKNGKQILIVSGFYTFIGTDGLEHYTDYTSDENGYTAQTKIMEPSIGIPNAALASLAGGGLG
ncbi:unnamed protein product [Ceutorhynchus assimilis]|uniref:Uncharacterized protein n=1 Tax=Ceutorhynchus assimilis TaxID=467358 RepID=A0A9N9QII2_9CUCU|nr:unnamed protein product [Ceutorhynchus assimilis]